MDGKEAGVAVAAKKPKSKKMLKIIIITVATLLVLAGAVAAYLFYFKQPTSAELYHQSAENALRAGTDGLYSSFEASSDDMKLRGEFIGSPDSEEGRFKTDLDVSFSEDDIPLELASEMILIGNDDSIKSYVKYNSLTSPDAEYGPLVEDFYAPIFNKWVDVSRDDEDEDEEDTYSFENDGPLAAFGFLSVFLPLYDLSEADQKIYLEAVEKYNLYQVDETVETAQFKGIEARQVRVGVNKDTLIEFEKEVSETLSDEADYGAFDTRFLDQLFGENDTLYVNVYIDPNDPQLMGASFDHALDESVVEESFGVEIDDVRASMLIEYDRPLTIEAPKDAITSKERDELLGS